MRRLTNKQLIALEESAKKRKDKIPHIPSKKRGVLPSKHLLVLHVPKDKKS